MNAQEQEPSYARGETGEELLEATIPAYMKKIVAAFSENLALVDVPGNIRWTYREFWEKTGALARGLRGLGFQRGDRIGIWSVNNPQWLLLQIATARLGIILVNLNPAYRARELSHALRKSRVQGLFFIPGFKTSDYVSIAGEVIPELKTAQPDLSESDPDTTPRRVVLYNPRDIESPDRPLSGLTLWSELMEQGASISDKELDAQENELDRQDTINIQYTSGTTGSPRAVALSHRNILNNAYFAARELGVESADSLCVTVPFYHCFGMVLSNLLIWSRGATLVLPGEYFQPGDVLAAVAQERCSILHGVPTMFLALLEHPDFASFDLSSLRTGIMAGAPCPASLVRRVRREMHLADIRIGYGQTEASPLTHITRKNDDERRQTETVGFNLPFQETKIVDPASGEIVPRGETGEICFRGYHVMKGYYGDPEATSRAIDSSGWLRSGDLGSMEDDGYLKITGRLKDMIIRGGENIYPREIEEFLLEHPDIAEAAVFGVPDEKYGEAVCAWIRPRPGATLSEEDIREYCAGSIAHFKIPKRIRFVEDFPLTVTGKIQKFRMREIETQEARPREEARERRTRRENAVPGRE